MWRPFQRRLKGLSHSELTLAIRDHVSRDYEVMVDSSKTAWGSFSIPFRLFKPLGQDFLLIHVVRDPRGVCWSALRTSWRPKKGRPPARLTGAFRVAVGWMAANLACETFGWRHRNNYLRVRYEDLIRTPAEVIGKILRKSSLTLPASLEPDDERDNRHQLYGNAMRFKALHVTDLREDLAWKSLMPRGYRFLVRAICWPLYKRYGYHTWSDNLDQSSFAS